MILVHLLPVVLSLLMLAAHFLRGGNTGLVAIVLGLVVLLFVRRPWAVRVVQGALVVGAAEWGRTLVVLAGERMQAGLPVVRLIFILGGVSLATILSALVLEIRAVRAWYAASRG